MQGRYVDYLEGMGNETCNYCSSARLNRAESAQAGDAGNWARSTTMARLRGGGGVIDDDDDDDDDGDDDDDDGT